MKILSGGSRVVHAGRQKYRQVDVNKLIVAFSNFVIKKITYQNNLVLQ